MLALPRCKRDSNSEERIGGGRRAEDVAVIQKKKKKQQAWWEQRNMADGSQKAVIISLGGRIRTQEDINGICTYGLHTSIVQGGRHDMYLFTKWL